MSMEGTELRENEIINSFKYRAAKYRAAREHPEPLSIRRWPEPCKYLIGRKSALL